MPIVYQIRRSEYHDSVALMEVARELNRMAGVLDVAVVMATEANLGLLRQADLLVPEMERATANDLIVAVQADGNAAGEQALAVAGERLTSRPQAGQSGAATRPRTLRGAVRSHAGANLAIVSVAGEHAAAEAWEALRNGLHVLLFSDNVSIEDEAALKRYAVEHGLLMMGADCGTAIINGVALGFANAVPRGPVGIVAAAGTGLQEVSTLLAKRGVGISQGIGTGGRDLKAAVGGLTMLQGLQALQADPDTEVLLLVSKPPEPVVAERVLGQVQASAKPTIVCFLGGDLAPVVAAGALPARTLWEAAYLAAAQVTGESAQGVMEQGMARVRAQARQLRERLRPGQRYLRGLYSGGTLATEALVVWKDVLGEVRSNVALDPRLELADAAKSEANCAIDLGEDEFTVGRPHPMIDNDLRIRRLMQEAADPEVAVIVLDVVLGYGAHPNPAGELGPAVERARAVARHADGAGNDLIVVASVTGTEDDPQVLSRQVAALERAGAIVASCNAAAARLAGTLVGREVEW